MTTANELLRLLNPAVRPVGLGAPTARAAPKPFEQQGFDELLAELSQAPASAEPREDGTAVATTSSATPRIPILDLTRIENASLRDLIAQRASPAAQDLPT